MNDMKLTRLAVCAAILIALLSAGCALNSSSEAMGGSMDTMMEEKGAEMTAPAMNDSMKQEPTMNEMETDMSTVDEMKSENGQGEMMRQDEKKMGPEKDKMMK